QGRRGAVVLESLGLAQQGGGQGQAEGDGLARTGLGADQQVAARLGLQHSRLHRRGLGVAAFGKRAVERGMTGGEGHGAVRTAPTRRAPARPEAGAAAKGRSYACRSRRNRDLWATPSVQRGSEQIRQSRSEAFR